MPPLDFQNPPITVGTSLNGPDGQRWTWDGDKWVFGGGTMVGGPFLPLSALPLSVANGGTGTASYSDNGGVVIYRNNQLQTLNSVRDWGDTSGRTIAFQISNDGPQFTGRLVFERGRGTGAPQTPVQNDDVIGLIQYWANPFVLTPDQWPQVQIRAYATENHSAAAHGTALDVWTTQNGTSIPQQSFVFGHSGYLTMRQGAFMGQYGLAVYGGGTAANPRINIVDATFSRGMWYTLGDSWPTTMCGVDGDWTFRNNLIVNGTWNNPSDRRLKTGTVPFERGLEEVLRLQPVRYHYDKRRMPISDDNDHFGLVADDVEQVLPELVHMGRFPPTGEDTEPSDEYKMLDVGSLTFVLINAIKQLTERVAKLEGK